MSEKKKASLLVTGIAGAIGKASLKIMVLAVLAAVLLASVGCGSAITNSTDANGSISIKPLYNSTVGDNSDSFNLSHQALDSLDDPTLYLRSSGKLSKISGSCGTWEEASIYRGLSTSWSYTLRGDIDGSSYGYSLYIYNPSSNWGTIKLEIISDTTTLVSKEFSVWPNGGYKLYSWSGTGEDPTTVDGDLLKLRITLILEPSRGCPTIIQQQIIIPAHI